MKIIKRIFALVPVVLVLLFSVVPLSSSAEVDLNPDSVGFLSEQFADFEDFAPYYNVENPTTYIIYKSYSSEVASKYKPWYRAVTHFIDLSDVEYSYADGVYSWDLSNFSSTSQRRLVEWEGEYRFNTENGTVYSSSGYNQKHDVYSVILDTKKQEFYVNDYKFPNSWFNMHSGAYVHFNLSYVIDGKKPDSSNEIEVESFPKLEGESTLNMYLLDNDGYPIPGKTSDRYLSTQLIDIDIRNNSTKDFQFALYIVPKGQSLSLVENPRQMLGSRFFSSNPLFIYSTEEWIYNITKIVSNREVNAVSCYHIAPAGSSFTAHIGENQLDLKSGIEYDLVCYGSFVSPHSNQYLAEYYVDGTVHDLPSYTISSIDPYIHFDSSNAPTEVYRQTFTLDRDTSYKNTQYSQDDSLQIGGLGTSYPFDPNSSNDDIFNTIYASKDEDGVANYKNSKFDGSYDSKHYDYAPYDRYNSNVGVNSNFGNGISLTSGFNSFFGMITDLLKHLPGSFLSIFTFGFTALVVVAIIKAVR